MNFVNYILAWTLTKYFICFGKLGECYIIDSMHAGMPQMATARTGTSSGVTSYPTNIAQTLKTINDAVGYVIGPSANPDQPIIQFALSQSGPPKSFMDILPYIPYLQRIGRSTYTTWLSEIAVQNYAKDANSNGSSSTTNIDNAFAGKTLEELIGDLDNVIVQRSIVWIQKQENQSTLPIGGGDTVGTVDKIPANQTQNARITPDVVSLQVILPSA